MHGRRVLSGGRRALSGMQLDILSLYRQLLRAARAKGSGTYDMVRSRFRTDVRRVM